MSTKTEIFAIADVVFELNQAAPERGVYCNIGPGHVSVTVFRKDGEIDWQENLYDWSHDEAYLPKLRWLRNELEQMLEAATAEKQREAA